MTSICKGIDAEYGMLPNDECLTVLEIGSSEDMHNPLATFLLILG